MIERHHNIPVSLEWPETPENIIPLKKHIHEHLHKTLHIPYRKIRNFRKKTNHKLVKDKEYIKELRKVHKLFFDERKLSKLAGDTVAQIAKSLGETTERVCANYDIQKELYDTDGSIKSVTNNLYKYHNGVWRASKKIMGL